MKLPTAYATSVRKKSIDMTLSVNPLGCSPRALKALRELDNKDIASYPDQAPLRNAIADAFRIPKNCIVLGNGSEQLIKLVSQTFLQKNDVVSVESGSFFLFSREPALMGGSVSFFNVNTPRAPRRKPALLFMANPTTPGGIDRSKAELLAAIDIISPRIAVIDEANGEFGNNSLIPEIPKRKNLIVLRTFSKALVLAGLRVGMALGNPDIIAKLTEFQQAFPVSSAALVAARMSLDDTDFLRKTRRFITAERIFITDQLQKRGFGVSLSATNNLFVSRKDSKKIIRELGFRDVSVIDGKFFPGNKLPGFRISLRDKRTNRAFLRILDEVLACLSTNKLLRSKEAI